MNFRKVISLFFVLGFVIFVISCKSLKETSQSYSQVEIKNKGIAGNTSRDLLVRLETSILSENPDLVILMVGTNDMLNSNKFVSYEEYCENLQRIVERIKSKNTQVLLMSSPTVDSTYLFMRHDKNAFKEAPNVKLQKAKIIVKEIAKTNNVLFLDINAVFKAHNLPIHNEDDYIRNEKNSNSKDGVHLTPLGYKLIAESIYDYIKGQGLQNKYKSIICFGDSLTKGSGVEGAGTTTGKTYPSFLFTMLNN